MADRPENTIVGCIKNGFLARMMNYSPPAIVAWLALANRADETARCHPSMATLQGDTGLARNTVYKGIDELVKAGEITVISGGGRGNPSNEYTIQGSSQNELVQSANQSNRRTKVVQSANKGSAPFRLKPDTRTRHKNQTGRAPAEKFQKPTVSEVKAYCIERKNQVDAQRFLDYYESNGWRVGKNPMRDWKAAVRTWEKNGFSNSSVETKKSEPLKYRG